MPLASRRRRRSLIALLAVLLVTGLAAGLVVGHSDSRRSLSDTGTRPPTTPIVRGTLSGVTQAQGTLQYADARTVKAGSSGVITELPGPGTVIGRGQALYRVDDLPVILLYGNLPAWRAFASGMSDGPDVAQLEQNLAALGYLRDTPDQHFDWDTKYALMQWQKALGQPQTGALPMGAVWFSPTGVRTGANAAGLGDQIGPGLTVLDVTNTGKQVSAGMDLSDQKLAVVGGKVSIVLPNAQPTPGHITSVGAPTQQQSASGSVTVIPVVIALDKPDDADGYQQADVTVSYTSQTRTDVLYVPVQALIALPGGGYGVQLVTADAKIATVAVTPGLFAGGNVEITGTGLVAGQNVVVPQL